VHDVQGRLVRTLLAGAAMEPGRHETVWDGRTDAGKRAATGLYFYTIDAGTFRATRRMMLVQ
jgi:hypothetical protein